MKASEWLQTFGEKFPTADARFQRESKILEAVIAGYMLSIEWRPIYSEVGDATVRIWVASDVLKIGEPDDFVRITTTAKTVQLIADYLDVRVITPKICDLIWLQADVRIEPQTNPKSVDDHTMMDTSNMVKHSRDVEAAIAGRTGTVADIGKHWSLVNALDQHIGMAAIFGWHTEHSRPVPDHPEWGPYWWTYTKGYIWQTVGMSHNAGTTGKDPGHVDYSMTDRAICRVVDVSFDERKSWQRIPYDDACHDPELCGAITYEKKMTCFRYPAVTYVPPEAPVPDPE